MAKRSKKIAPKLFAELRDLAGFTHQDLEDRVGVARPQIVRYERGNLGQLTEKAVARCVVVMKSAIRRRVKRAQKLFEA